MITFRRMTLEEAEEQGRSIYSSLRTFDRSVLVAFVDGVAVGHILWEGNLVTDLSVDEEYRSKGIGKALLKNAEREMISQGFGAAIVPATEKPDYYEHQGYLTSSGPRAGAFKDLL